MEEVDRSYFLGDVTYESYKKTPNKQVPTITHLSLCNGYYPLFSSMSF